MKEDRRRRKSRAALRGALLDMMKQKSLSQITVKSLCEAADINRSTFYANYETMEALLSDIHAEFFCRVEAMIAAKEAQPGVPVTTTAEEFLRIIHLMSAPDSPLPILLKNNDSRLFERNMVLHFMARYELMQASCAERYIFTYRSIGSFTIIAQWIREGMPCPAEELAALLSRMSKKPD